MVRNFSDHLFLLGKFFRVCMKGLYDQLGCEEPGVGNSHKLGWVSVLLVCTLTKELQQIPWIGQALLIPCSNYMLCERSYPGMQLSSNHREVDFHQHLLYSRSSFHSWSLKSGRSLDYVKQYIMYPLCTQHFPGLRADSSPGPNNTRGENILAGK